ncbi:glycerophosphodiester phosphodiesterase [Hymenobacter gummosus]|uniref:Glycerophosphodiester phosphodiesterase n=1 Tax=Hymenobacter gummosus TaxID=1776032 RepID=A0A3S0H570_9BACT|nr:glycerophosphodiester phosphodiesterase family protein [Hymenobacter gummosus]RTQ48402.1 glycerophosphodiester phosphodiesterase [Hymenobacter gummosus]
MTDLLRSSLPLIYGHRGCRGLRPENTIPAFLHALQWPIDGLELDVVMSADGQVVVSHEPWLNPAICSAPDGGPITPDFARNFRFYQQSYAAIRRFDCGQRRHPAFPQQLSVPAFKPLLHEVFDAVEARCRELKRPVPAYSIELKSTPEGDGIDHPTPELFVQAVEQVVAASRALHQRTDTLYMSFDHRVVAAARRLTRRRVCLLVEDHHPLTEHIAQLGFIPEVLGPDYELLTLRLLTRCAELELPVVAWTVNETALIKSVAARGVHGITTDYPNRAVQALR